MALSDEHKEALAIGRRESRAVRAYLEDLESPRRRRRRPTERVRAELADTEASLEQEGRPMQRLWLIQKRIDLNQELNAPGTDPDRSEAVESAFVAAVAGYSRRKKISWQAWREVGVPAAVLRKGGVAP